MNTQKNLARFGTEAMHQRIEQLIRTGLKALEASGVLPESAQDATFTVERPREVSHGDVATNVAMVLAKDAGVSPRELAGGLAECLADEIALDEWVAKLEIAGPGFINFRLTPRYQCELLRAVRSAQFGRWPEKSGPRVLVEFVSANPTGPMLVVQARAAALGDVLCTLLERTGAVATREYYVNDAGGQLEKLGASLEARIRQQQGEDQPVPEEGYPGDYLIEMAQQYLREHPDFDPPTDDKRMRHRALGRFAADIIVEEQRDLLVQYGVVFDSWYRESVVRESGEPEKVLALLSDKGYLYEAGGARWLRSTDFGDDKDRVLVKQDGGYTYLLPDLAYHKGKFDRGHDHLIDIWGPDHHGYIARMGAGLAALGYDPKAFEVLISQWVRLLRGDEEIRMSKRSGDFITMRALLDEVGRDAARFLFLMRSPDSPLDFDLELAKTQSQENPVYYAQYAHARIASVLENARQKGMEIPEPHALSYEQLGRLTMPEERELIRRLGDFPGELQQAARAREPHRVAAYVLDLAARFHVFYTECRILGTDVELTQARLYLAAATAGIIRECLEILGVSAPLEM